MQRTFRLDRLYHKFLKPKGADISLTYLLAAKLYEAGFIEIVRDKKDPDLERYTETEKLTSRQHRDELFKLIQGIL